MNIKKLLTMITMLFFSIGIHTALAECSQPDKNHVDKNVTRCPYSQEDLNRAHKNVPDRCESENCFFCGCTKESHTKKQ